MIDTSLPTATPRVIVLMAVYNGMQWLEAQTESILAQQGVEVSLFISVDQSQDDSANWCQQLAERESRVVLLPVGTRHGSAAKNFFHLLKSVDFSDCHYISFADQDDIWHLDKLQRATQVLQGGHYQAYSSNVTAWWENGKKRLLNKAQPLKRWDYLFESGGPGCTYVLSQPLALKIQKCLQQLPAHATQLNFHDWFCYAFTRAANIPWYIDPIPSVIYRQHSNNAVGINQGWRPFINRTKHVLSGQAFIQAALTYQTVFHDQVAYDPIDIPTKRWSFVKLALKSRQCRRRPRDQFYFFCLCLIMTLRGS